MLAAGVTQSMLAEDERSAGVWHAEWQLVRECLRLTAHVASASARFDEARKRRVGYELSLVLQGMWPVSCVNPSVLQNTSLP